MSWLGFFLALWLMPFIALLEGGNSPDYRVVLFFMIWSGLHLAELILPFGLGLSLYRKRGAKRYLWFGVISSLVVCTTLPFMEFALLMRWAGKPIF